MRFVAHAEVFDIFPNMNVAAAVVGGFDLDQIQGPRELRAGYEGDEFVAPSESQPILVGRVRYPIDATVLAGG